MGLRCKIFSFTMAAALLCGASVGAAAPGEPLVVTQLPDPDPNYIPLPDQPKGTAQRRDADENQTLDQAMEDFGRAIGQAGMVIRQKAEAACRDKIPATVPTEQRYAWEANCRYQRY